MGYSKGANKNVDAAIAQTTQQFIVAAVENPDFQIWKHQQQAPHSSGKNFSASQRKGANTYPAVHNTQSLATSSTPFSISTKAIAYARSISDMPTASVRQIKAVARAGDV